MNKPKISTEIKTKLFSSDTFIVLEALDLLKDKGNKNYMPILFELLLSKPEAEVEKEIIQLLGTIKDKEAVPVFIGALTEDKFKTVRKEILTACWQNGLDFSSGIDIFADIVINDEWEVAFEAFTVIENMEHLPAKDDFKETKLKIARALKSANEQKVYFLEELLRMAP